MSFSDMDRLEATYTKSSVKGIEQEQKLCLPKEEELCAICLGDGYRDCRAGWLCRMAHRRRLYEQ